MTNPNIRNPQANSLFRDRYGNSPNFMTPHIWSRRMIAAGRLAVELSSGEGILQGTEVWGVTVLIVSDIRANSGLSECFDTRAEAEAYIESLRKWRPDADAIAKRETVTGGERLTMASGEIWFHPFNGGAPVREV